MMFKPFGHLPLLHFDPQWSQAGPLSLAVKAPKLANSSLLTIFTSSAKLQETALIIRYIKHKWVPFEPYHQLPHPILIQKYPDTVNSYY